MEIMLAGVPEQHVRARLAAADGKEIESGKFGSPESSAALAVNCFGWFIPRPDLLPRFPGFSCKDWAPGSVEVECCARFPWSGGKHPWLDAFIQTPTYLIGVESKRFEPYRDRKKVYFSPTYCRPVWGGEMTPFERMRDALTSGEEHFIHLDAAQLVKHAFGLVTEGSRQQRSPALVYVFAEPEKIGTQPITALTKHLHRKEVARFARAVEGAAVPFCAFSYREWLETWSHSPNEVKAHGKAVDDTFRP